jgi:hypothetical protein
MVPCVNRPLRQLRVALAAVAAMAGVGVSTVHAAAESELGQLTVSTAPAGYAESTDASALSGDYTFDELAEATGQSLDGVDDAQTREFAAFARTWDAPDGGLLLVLLVRTPSDAEAASFLTGVLDSAGSAGSAGYPTGVPGTTGRIVQGAASPMRIVAWRQGRYAVQIASAASTADAAQSAAKQLAIDQVARLTPAAGQPGGEVESDNKGVAYTLGGLAFVGAIVGPVVYLATRGSRKRAAAATPWMGNEPASYPLSPLPTPRQQGQPPPPASPFG